MIPVRGHSPTTVAEQTPGRCLAAFVLTIALLVIANPASAEGRFEVINATSRAEDNAWLIDARVDLELSSEALEALNNGVTLRIAFQYEVIRRRRFWADESVVSTQQDFELQYLSLSQRYVVRDVSEGTVNSYATLFSALRYLGQVRDYELVSQVPDGNPRSYTLAMRAVLDWEKLPGPLAVLTFWRGDFSLESDWYRWIPN